jgi:Cu(I)/Ag(I) efflux system membrane fusion protein
MPAGESISGKVNPDFKKQLTRVYDQYLSFKNALVESDPVKARQELNKLKDALENTDMTLLKGNAHGAWMDQLNKMNEAISTVNGEADLELQRRAMAPISDALYRSIKQFGIQKEEVYYQYCPMAIENQGAFWLSEVEDINNPYFGETMLKCGETRETITE